MWNYVRINEFYIIHSTSKRIYNNNVFVMYTRVYVWNLSSATSEKQIKSKQRYTVW